MDRLKLILAFVIASLTLPAQAIISSALQAQSSGSALGGFTILNCSTNVTCTLSGGTLTVTSSGGGGGGLTINSTTISGGGTNAILYGDGTVLQNESGLTRTGAGQITSTQNALGVTTAKSIILTNTTAAANAAQQVSPAISLQGNAWNTASGGSSKPEFYNIYVTPVQSGGYPYPALTFEATADTGAGTGKIVFNGYFSAINPAVQVGVAGTGISALVSGTLDFSVQGGEVLQLKASSATITSNSEFAFSNSTSTFTTLDTSLDRDTAGIIGITNGTPGTTAANYRDLKLRHLGGAGNAPTITSGFGSSPTIDTNASDTAGRLVVGTGAGTTTGVITFGTTFANIPACHATDETTANLMQAVATATTLTINGVMVASDKLTWICVGLKN